MRDSFYLWVLLAALDFLNYPDNLITPPYQQMETFFGEPFIYETAAAKSNHFWLDFVSPGG